MEAESADLKETQMMINHDEKIYQEYIRALLFDTEQASLPRDQLSGKSEELANSLEYLGECVKEEQRILTQMADGDLSGSCDPNNHLAAQIKSIQSNLRHLSWVAERVSNGDYRQRVRMLGEFSDSFNHMIEQLQHNQEELEKSSNTDVLTGIGNRRAFNQMIERLWKDCRSCSIGFIDIDGLKYCNDHYGHGEGDHYILETCSRLQSLCKENEYLFRMGGDEFLILSETDSADALRQRLEQTHLEFQKEMEEKVEYPCDFSFGCAGTDEESVMTVSELLTKADDRMYEFKIRNYIDRKYPVSQDSKNETTLDRSGLDSRIFDAFSLTLGKRYIYLCNMETGVSRWSLQAVEDFGLPSEYMFEADKIWENYIHPDDRELFKKDIELVFSGRKPFHDIEYRARLKDGTYVRCTCEGCVLKGRKKGEPNLLAGSMINHGVVVHIDPVTCCNNVYAFLQELQRRRKKQDGVLFLTIGIRQYSDINNIYGYEVGDSVLRSFADYLDKLIPETKRIYRVDGVKFAIILPVDMQNEIRDLFFRIKEAGEQGILAGGERIRLSVYGISIQFKHMPVSESIVFHELMHLMTDAKQSNGGLYEYNFEKTLEVQKKMELADTIKRSILENCEGFYMLYQPQVDRNGKVLGVESLLRWKHEKYGVVLPDSFIPWLEKESCFYVLGLWLLRTTVMETRRFLKEHPDFKVSVNVSWRQFAQEKFVQDVCDILEEEHFPASNLILELTEHCQALDEQILKWHIAEFHKYGVGISADDFGSGYSSFNLMKTLDFDCIKIDQSFIRNILVQPADQIMVQSIINCAKALGVSVCVEGIESEEIFRFIREADPGMYQGYLFAQPLTVTELEKFLK